MNVAVSQAPALDPERDFDEPRQATKEESQRLRSLGFFLWGSPQAGSWIHEDDEGTVYATDRALEFADQLEEERAQEARRRYREDLIEGHIALESGPRARNSGLAS